MSDKVTFVASASGLKNCPPPSLPEVAFAGRSNVGKSSLINFLLNRKGLARVSNTPGRTRLINFFDVDGKFQVADLPGYGYAKVPNAEREKWRPMVEGYLQERPTLRVVVVLLDSRREPTGEDLMLLEWLAHLKVPCLIAVTKMDKIPKTKRLKRLKELAASLHLPLERLTATSVLEKIGRQEVWKALEPYLKEKPEEIAQNAPA